MGKYLSPYSGIQIDEVVGLFNSDKNKNYVLAAPSSAAGVPVFRTLEADDIPVLTKSKISDLPQALSVSIDSTNPQQLNIDFIE